MDDITPGELGRRHQELREDMHRGFESINTRLDDMPTQKNLILTLAPWTVRIDTLDKDVAALKAARDRDKRDRQWLIGACLVPLAVAILAIVVALGGQP